MNSRAWTKARKKLGLRQADVSRELGVSQAYVSMVERGERDWPRGRLAKAVRVYGLSPAALALPSNAEGPSAVDPDELMKDLAALGYPGFSHVRARRQKNPAQVLLTALAQPDLDSRLTEALPWLVLKFEDLNWEWLVRNAKSNDLQNRLGFVTTLARRLAELNTPDSASKKAQRLAEREAELERSRLEREDTLCGQSLTRAERLWLEESRPPDAARWHLWTDLAPQHIRYVAAAM